MARRKHKNRTPTPPTLPAPVAAESRDGYHDSLPLRHRHAGGVNLGLRSHWVAAPPLPDGTPQVAEFDTDTDSLEALADWLTQHGVTTVALEATGVYGEPLFAILQERGFEVILVAPTYTSGIKGRPKTDRLDCQWIQRLHAHGQGRDVEDVSHKQLQRLKKSGELPPLEPKPRQRGRKPNDPRFDVRAALYYVTGIDLTELEGIAEVTALVVVSEIGLDMSRFPSVKHFCAWLGLCPVVKQSGRTKAGKRKVKSAQTRRGRGRAAQALCLAASSLWQNRSALGSFLRRLEARLGPEKAVTATAHKLARLVYQTLKSGVSPAKVSAADYEAAQQAR